VGGIDFNPNNIDLKTKGSGVKIQFPTTFIKGSIKPVDGLRPVIINISPVINIPMILGDNELEEDQKLSYLVKSM